MKRLFLLIMLIMFSFVYCADLPLVGSDNEYTKEEMNALIGRANQLYESAISYCYISTQVPTSITLADTYYEVQGIYTCPVEDNFTALEEYLRCDKAGYYVIVLSVSFEADKISTNTFAILKNDVLVNGSEMPRKITSIGGAGALGICIVEYFAVNDQIKIATKSNQANQTTTAINIQAYINKAHKYDVG